METETKTEGEVIDTTNDTGEGKTDENISIPKKDYDTLNQTLGSLKRELKDLRKAKEETKDEPKTSKTNQADESRTLEKVEKLSLRLAGITHPDDIELARKIAKETGKDIDVVLESKYFKVELEELQAARANVEATSGIKGGDGKSQAKFSPEYWIAKGVPPTAADVPDRKVRAQIARAMMASTKNTKKFYND